MQLNIIYMFYGPNDFRSFSVSTLLTIPPTSRDVHGKKSPRLAGRRLWLFFLSISHSREKRERKNVDDDQHVSRLSGIKFSRLIFRLCLPYACGWIDTQRRKEYIFAPDHEYEDTRVPIVRVTVSFFQKRIRVHFCHLHARPSSLPRKKYLLPILFFCLPMLSEASQEFPRMPWLDWRTDGWIIKGTKEIKAWWMLAAPCANEERK